MQELKRMREEAGLTQVGLAEASGVDRGTIIRIEQGKRSPTIETLEKLAVALKVEVAAFFPLAQAPLPLLEGWETGREAAGKLSTIWSMAQRELAAWRESRDRKHLDAVGDLLQNAYDMTTRLLEDVPGARVEGTNIQVRVETPEQSEKLEIARLAELFYRALIGVVEAHGLNIVAGTSQDAERPQEVIPAA